MNRGIEEVNKMKKITNVGYFLTELSEKVMGETKKLEYEGIDITESTIKSIINKIFNDDKKIRLDLRFDNTDDLTVFMALVQAGHSYLNSIKSLLVPRYRDDFQRIYDSILEEYSRLFETEKVLEEEK